jgi:hypothetical protein
MVDFFKKRIGQISAISQKGKGSALTYLMPFPAPLFSPMNSLISLSFDVD